MKTDYLEFNERQWLKSFANMESSHLELIRCMHWPKDTTLQLKEIALQHHLLVFVEKGKFLLRLNGKPLSLGAGTILLLSPTVVRDMWIPKGVTVSNFRVHFQLKVSEKMVAFYRPYQIITNAHRLKPYFQRLHYLQSLSSPYANFSIRAVMTDFFAEFFARQEQSFGTKKGKGLSPSQFHKVEEFLQSRLSYAVSPSDLAKVAELTDSYFTRLFRQSCGVAPRTYIKQKRLEKASILLRESLLKVNEVATVCGFHNIHLFHRQFKEQFNCTPKEFRNRL